MTALGRLSILLPLLATLAGCGSAGVMAPAKLTSKISALKAGTPGQPTRFLASNTCYRVGPRIRVFLDQLDADLVLRAPGTPLDPSDKESFAIAVRHAVARQEPASLEALLNEHVFGDAKAPLKDLKVGVKGEQVTLAGKLDKGLWVPFEMTGAIGATADGRVSFKPKEIRSLGVRVDGLMALVGLDLARMLKARQEKGVVIEGNEVLLDPGKMFPAPRLLGPVVAVKVNAGLLEYRFQDGADRPLPALPVKAARNWVALWGGALRCQDVVTTDAKVQLVDAHPQDPFVYALEFYRESLAAGFVTMGVDGRMAAYLPDANSWTADWPTFQPSLPLAGMKALPSDMAPFPN